MFKKIFGACLGFLLLLSSEGFSSSSTPAPINDIYVVHFILDGANAGFVEKLMKEGKLPHLQHLIEEQGIYIPKAITPFPTTSTTSYQNFTSGLMPGNAGIPHLERFDRITQKKTGYLDPTNYQHVNRDFFNVHALEEPSIHDLDYPSTIFELLKGYPTAAVYSSFHKGASEVYPRGIPVSALVAAATHNYLNLDRLALHRTEKLFKRSPHRIPRYTLVGLLSSDLSGHEYGTTSRAVADSLIQFDHFIGSFAKLLEQRSLKGKTFIIVSSDHGMHDTGKYFSLDQKFFHDGIALKPNNPHNHHYTIASSDRGVSSTQIYLMRDLQDNLVTEPIITAESLRNIPPKRGSETSVDLIKVLLGYDETELVAVRDGYHRIMLFGKDSTQAAINCSSLQDQTWCSYRPITARDPLHYLETPSTKMLADGHAHSLKDWLEASWNHLYPDAPWQLFQAFLTPRSGDAYVIAKPEYSFRKVKAATHGSLQAADMAIPVMLMGPEKIQAPTPTLRSVDLYPMILNWFHVSRNPHLFDGDLSTPSKKQSEAWDVLAKLDGLFADQPRLDKLIDTHTFIFSRVRSILPFEQFSKMLPLAQQELKLRSDRVKAIIDESKQLEQRSKNHKIRGKEHKRMMDHTSVARFRLNAAWDDLHRIEDIVHVLTSCQQPQQETCTSL